MKITEGISEGKDLEQNGPSEQNNVPKRKPFTLSIKHFVLMGVAMYLIYVIQVLGPFHYNHHLYSSHAVPPNSARRRSIILLSHHIYYAAKDDESQESGRNFIGDTSKKDLREQWHRTLSRASVSDDQIESVLSGNYPESFDLGDLIRYVMTIGEFQQELFVRPRNYAQQLHMSLHQFGNATSNTNTHRVTVTNVNNNQALNGPIIDVDIRNPPIVMFESFPTSIQVVSYSNIYRYFDDLIAFVRKLRQYYRKSLVVWVIPSTISTSSDDDLKKLFHHIIINHLIVRFGLITVPFMPDSMVLKAMASQLSIIYHHADLYYKLYTNEHRSNPATLGGESTDVIGRLATINNYLRPLYESEGTITMFDVLHGNSRNTIDNSTKLTLHALCDRYLNTRKYVYACMPQPTKRYPLLITGLGGTGTHYLANQLQQLGFRINHESIGKQGAVVSSILSLSVCCHVMCQIL